MTRNVKTLGLGLAAAMVIGAMVASVASGASATFTAHGMPPNVKAKIHGEQSGINKLKVGLMSISCASNTVTGEALTAGSQTAEVTLTPRYENCHALVAGLTKAVTVTPNECSYLLKATKNTGGKPFTADLTLVCLPGKHIEIHVYKNKEYKALECAYDISHQTVSDQIELTNQANSEVDDILAHFSMTLSVTNTLKSIVCGQNDPEPGVYSGTFTLTATTNNFVSVDTTVS